VNGSGGTVGVASKVGSKKAFRCKYYSMS